jgi:hypothetical protein
MQRTWPTPGCQHIPPLPPSSSRLRFIAPPLLPKALALPLPNEVEEARLPESEPPLPEGREVPRPPRPPRDVPRCIGTPNNNQQQEGDGYRTHERIRDKRKRQEATKSTQIRKKPKQPKIKENTNKCTNARVGLFRGRFTFALLGS